MGILCIFIGILFFSNPSFRLLDYLPDVIGCIFIISGTTKLAYTNHKIEHARKYTIYYAIVSAVKVILSLYIPIKSKDLLLPATFGFSVLECILMIGIFVSLFGGLEYIISRGNYDNKHLANSENASIISFIFVISRAVVSFIPELFSLGTQKDSFDYTFAPSPEKETALLKPYIELLAFVVILIFGMYFAFVCGKYLLGLYRDKNFKNALFEKYTFYLSENAGSVNLKRVRCALLIFLPAIVLLFNQILDFVNVIPNTLSYLFLVAGTVYMVRSLGCRKLKLTLPAYLPLISLSIYNNIIQYKLLSGTRIDFLNDTMFVREVPEILKNTSNLVGVCIPIIIEYVVLAILLFTILRTFQNLEFMANKDTVSIFEILFCVSVIIYFLSSIYVYLGQFVRTAFTYISASLDIYVKYDTILALCEWASIFSFFAMLYFAYRYASDILSDISTQKKI